MSPEPTAFDMGAAWLRRAQGDTKAFMEGLAVRLEGALPGHVSVERARDGLLSAHRHVSEIRVSFEHGQYTLAVHHHQLAATRARMVRGVVISTQTLPIPAWMEALFADIQALGAAEEAASAMLHDFLMS